MTTKVEWHSNTAAVLHEATAAAEQGTQDAADKLLALSRALVPTDHGDLRDSGRVSYETEGDHQLAAVAYGVPGTGTGVNAQMQHERTEYRHPHGGQAKYLEQPLYSQAEALAAIVHDAVAAALAGGAT